MHQQNQTMLSYGDLLQRPSQPLPRTYRASNDDRHRVIELLQAHYVAGRLSSSELESRVEQALAAVTFGDLDVVVADLPTLDAARPAAAEQPRNRDNRHQRRARKQHSAHGEKSFRAHATSYLLVMAMLVIIWVLTTPFGYFWPVWPMLGWGIGLVAHGLAARSRPTSVIGYQ
jgi:hypothetical protein